MALKYPVLAYEVNNLSDARYFAGMGVEMISFPLDNGAMNMETFEGIREWIEGIYISGAFANEHEDKINEISESLNLDYIHIQNPDIDCSKLNKPVIQQLSFKDEVDEVATAFQRGASLYVIENKDPDRPVYDDINALKNLYFKDKLLIGYGINFENIHEIHNQLLPYGFALKGGQEIRPGFKDFDEMADILEAIETD